MSLDLTLRLIESVNSTPAGRTTIIDIAGPTDLAVAQRWAAATGNTLLTVHPGGVEILRGPMTDPIEALPEDRRPGSRLWLYTNFHCNLACDYCCVESSPRTSPRVLSTPDFAEFVDQAVGAGVRELYITGGEPFMLLDLDERLRVALARLPTTVLTNAMLWRGERRERLDALPRADLTLQVSLDSATATLHDRHRGTGSFDRTIDGIQVAITLGFRVRVAATLGHDAGTAETDLTTLCDSLGLGPDQRIIRRVAKQGAATQGQRVSRASLVPEVCVTVDGVWWHPVAATDPAMKVADYWVPLDEAIRSVRAEYREHRVRGDVLANTFPCA